MSDTENITTTPTAHEHEEPAELRPTSSRRAAAIEAAYILEAVRK